MEFDWDEHNLHHISLHGVTREDVEAALVGRTLFVKMRSGVGKIDAQLSVRRTLRVF